MYQEIMSCRPQEEYKIAVHGSHKKIGDLVDEVLSAFPPAMEVRKDSVCGIGHYGTAHFGC